MQAIPPIACFAIGIANLFTPKSKISSAAATTGHFSYFVIERQISLDSSLGSPLSGSKSHVGATGGQFPVKLNVRIERFRLDFPLHLEASSV